MSNEFERIARIKGMVARQSLQAQGGEWTVGIGDDAAVFQLGDHHWISSVDTQVEGVHFRPGWLSCFELGYRATMAAASDLAAMGAEPSGMLSSLIVPESFPEDSLDELVKGQAAAGDKIGMPLVGGNLTGGNALSLSTTVLGVTTHVPLRRQTARPGDKLWLIGECGLAAAGLRWLLENDREAREQPAALEKALRAWRRPEARCAAVLESVSQVRAAIDLSDGLSSDALHLACASGVDLVLDASSLVSDAVAQAANVLQVEPMALACHGGEDYSVLLAVPESRSLPQGRPIGTCVAKRSHEARLWLRRDGTDTALEPQGYEHFAEKRRT